MQEIKDSNNHLWPNAVGGKNKVSGNDSMSAKGYAYSGTMMLSLA